MLKCVYISEELIDDFCQGHNLNLILSSHLNLTFELDLKSESSQVTFQWVHEQGTAREKVCALFMETFGLCG